MKNCPELKETNGYYAVDSRDVTLAGREFVKSVQTVDKPCLAVG